MIFGEDDSGKIRMLGSWMSWKDDVKKRVERGNSAWWKCRNRVKGTRISRRLQARVVEVCVESTMLFDCHVRTWQAGELKKLQKVADRAYRYVWGNGKMPPLRQMQAEHKNMADVRRELGVKSIRWKVEKRVYERIGHVMRMEDGRVVKAAVLGWIEHCWNSWRDGTGCQGEGEKRCSIGKGC